MKTMIPTGLPGVTMSAGDHICAFYRGDEERDAMLVPYLSAGLVAGDHCVCVLDRSEPDDFIALLDGLESEQLSRLSLMRSADSYLVGGGFSPDDMLSFWADLADTAFSEEGSSFLRAVGEMTWALGDLPGVDLLVAYEAELNRFLPKYPQTILCLYDLELFTDGSLLIDILCTHPQVLMSGMLIDNPWFIEPDQFLNGG